MEYSDYDITSGFVLEQSKALEYLKWCAEQFYERAVDEDAEYISAIDDCISMAQQVKDWDWVLFMECQMSASNMTVKEMIEKR